MIWGIITLAVGVAVVTLAASAGLAIVLVSLEWFERKMERKDHD